ncbi:MAG: winged helix-turn-helix transcriptional regulator [Thermoplasmata archaeon]
MKEISDKIIKILYEGELTQRELRNRLNISKSYLSEILKAMENDGYIQRKMVSKRTIIVGLNRKKFLRIGILKASEYAAVFLTAKDIDYLKIDINIYNNSLEEMKDLLTERIDIAFAPAITGLIFHLVDNSVIMISACSRGGSGIIYKENVEYMGSTLLSTMDLKSRIFSGGNVKIRYFSSPEEIIDSYLSGKIQAMAIWEPYFTMVNRGEKIQLAKDLICCGLITLNKNLDERIIKFNEKFKKNSEELRLGRRREEASILISERLNIPFDVILKSLESYEFETDVNDEDIHKLTETLGINLNQSMMNSFINKK